MARHSIHVYNLQMMVETFIFDILRQETYVCLRKSGFLQLQNFSYGLILNMLTILNFKILLPVRRHLQITETHCFHFNFRTNDVKSLTLDEIGKMQLFVNR